MGDFFYEYGLFIVKTLTLVVAVVVVIAASTRVARRGESGGHLEVTSLNDQFEDNVRTIREAVLDEAALKQARKAERKQEKRAAKERAKRLKKGEDPLAGERKRIYVLDFDGDIQASEADQLREEVTAVLEVATPRDEVVVRLESAGGLVHSYGFAASQLQRIRDAGIPLVVCVDRVAASGGYMMACVADRLIAAPFAVVGSIGVVAQIPNFHRLLKKNDIDVEILTAGEYKRTLTVFGENTSRDRQKFIEDLEDTHELFKRFVSQHRPRLNIAEVANGDVWFGQRALEKKLVDALGTSDDYLARAAKEADIFRVRYVEKKPLSERLGLAVAAASDRLLINWVSRLQRSRFLS